MFRVTADMKPLLAELKKREGALQRVTARTLNALAAQANVGQVANTKKRVRVRTTYTTNSMRIYKASEAKPVSRQNSVVGTVSPYMGLHDEDFKSQSTTGGRMPVPHKSLRGADRMKKIPMSNYADEMGDFGSPGNKFFRLDPHGTANPRKSTVLKRNVVQPRTGHNKVEIFGRTKGFGRKKNGRRAQKRVAGWLKTSAVFWRKSKRVLVRVRNLKDTGYKVKGTRFHSDAVQRVWRPGNVERIFVTVAGRVLK